MQSDNDELVSGIAYTKALIKWFLEILSIYDAGTEGSEPQYKNECTDVLAS